MSEQPERQRPDDTPIARAHEIPSTGPNEARNRPDEDEVDESDRFDAG
jgi:hypothetical protein